MVGKSNKSTGLGQLGHPHQHHHHHRSYGVNHLPKLGAGSSKCSSGKHNLLGADFNSPNSNRRQNVAIATQVINPSAIGGSLHRRRLVRPFEADDDDDESFGGRRGRSRFNWGKIGCYGVSILGVLLVMTGVVLAVGYMQSEKQRILSNSAKLAQDHNATLVLINEVIPDSPFNISIDESDSLTYPGGPFDNAEDGNSHGSTSTDEEVQIIEPSTPTNTDDGIEDHDFQNSQYESEQPTTGLSAENVSHEINTPATTVAAIDPEITEKSPVLDLLPPKNLDFGGISFDIPIYNASGKDETSFTFQVIPHATTQAPSSPASSFQNFPTDADPELHLLDTPIVAKLQTDLFEAGSDSGEDVGGTTRSKYEEVLPSKNKGRSHTQNNGGNPPKVNVPDHSYTPRPSSIHRHSERPRPPSRPTPYKQSMKIQTGDSSANAPIGGSSSNENRDRDNGPHVSVVPPPDGFKFPPTTPAVPPPTEYPKFDFSNLVPTNNNAKESATIQPVTLSPLPFDFKFDFTTPSAVVTLPPTSVDLRFDFNNFATAHGLDLKGGNPAAPSLPNNHIEQVDYTQFTATTSPPTASPSSYSHNVNLDPVSESHLSKRTFQFQPFQFDSAGASSNTNHFAHLLGPSPVSSSIGSASSLGASLNLYNFDSGISSSNNYGGNSYSGNNFNNFGEENTRLAPGTIPLDLASSYIQAGPPGKIYGNNNGGGGGDSSSNSFSYDPTLALASLIQNNPSSGNNGGHNSQPNYNTITQGMHLLSLLSGNIPNHLLPGGGADQFTAASNNVQQDFAAKPEYQIAALTGYGGSSNAFLSGLNSGAGVGSAGSFNSNPYLIQPAESRSLGHSPAPQLNYGAASADLYPSKTFTDQDGSFSQNIISKLNKFGGKLPEAPGAGQEQGSSVRSGKSLTSIPKLPSTVEDHGPSLDILGIRALLNKFIESGSTLSGSAKTESVPQSQDPSPQKTGADLETAASELMTQSQLKRPDAEINLNPEFGRKLILKTTRQGSSEDRSSEFTEKSEKGLKSGFYV